MRLASGPAPAHPIDAAPVRRRVVLTVIGFLVLGTVGAGWWGLAGRDGHEEVVAVSDAIGFPGGFLRVDAVRPEIMNHQMTGGMPASMMPDPVPDGHQRFSVDVTVWGTSSSGLAVDPGDFAVEGTGIERVTPHRSSGLPVTVARDELVSASLLFQTPSAPGTLWLTYAGAPERIVLAGDLGESHHRGDGTTAGDGHDHDHDVDRTVRIVDGRFAEESLTVAPGSTIEWVNEDTGVSHTVTFLGDGPDSGVLRPGGSFQLTLDDPAVYTYVCMIHPSMRASVTVSG